MPFRWQECLQFPGVWDYGMVPHVLNSLTEGGRHAVVPAQELLDDAREAIRVARVGDRMVAYLPRTTALKLHGSFADMEAVAFDLEDRRVAHLPVRVDAQTGTTRVEQHPFGHDALVILKPAAH